MQPTLYTYFWERPLVAEATGNFACFSETLVEPHALLTLFESAVLVQSTFRYIPFFIEVGGMGREVQDAFEVQIGSGLYCIPFEQRLHLPDAQQFIMDFTTYNQVYAQVQTGDTEIYLDGILSARQAQHGLIFCRLVVEEEDYDAHPSPTSHRTSTERSAPVGAFRTAQAGSGGSLADTAPPIGHTRHTGDISGETFSGYPTGYSDTRERSPHAAARSSVSNEPIPATGPVAGQPQAERTIELTLGDTTDTENDADGSVGRQLGNGRSPNTAQGEGAQRRGGSDE